MASTRSISERLIVDPYRDLVRVVESRNVMPFVITEGKLRGKFWFSSEGFTAPQVARHYQLANKTNVLSSTNRFVFVFTHPAVEDFNWQRRRSSWWLSNAQKNSVQLRCFKLHFDLQVFPNVELFFYLKEWDESRFKRERNWTHCTRRKTRPRSKSPSQRAGSTDRDCCSAWSSLELFRWHWRVLCIPWSLPSCSALLCGISAVFETSRRWIECSKWNTNEIHSNIIHWEI